MMEDAVDQQPGAGIPPEAIPAQFIVDHLRAEVARLQDQLLVASTQAAFQAHVIQQLTAQIQATAPPPGHDGDEQPEDR